MKGSRVSFVLVVGSFVVLAACAKPKEHPPELVLGNDGLPVTCDGLVATETGARVGAGRTLVVDDEPAACFVDGQLCPLPPGFPGASCPSDGGAVLVVASCTSEYVWVERCLTSDAGAGDAADANDGGAHDAEDAPESPDTGATTDDAASDVGASVDAPADDASRD